MSERRATKVVRIPEATAKSVKWWAIILGFKTPGEALAQAFKEYDRAC